MAPSPKTLKVLFARSGNRCAFPSCREHLITKEDVVLADICHIRSPRKDGPRYDRAFPAEKLHAPCNLVLFCCNHHRLIDSLPANYTSEKLLIIKKEHEQIMSNELFEVSGKAIHIIVASCFNSELQEHLANSIDLLQGFIEDGSIWQQQTMNRTAGAIATMLEVKLAVYLLRLSRILPAQDLVDLATEQEKWEESRREHVEKAGVQYRGGSIEAMVHATVYSEMTKNRIAELYRRIDDPDA